MNSLARVVLKKSAGLHLRRAGLEALPRAASSAPCNVPSMYVSKRYNSSVQNGDKVVEAAANAVDSTGLLEQAASIVANNAAEVAVAAEHSNFVIRNVMAVIENVHNFVGIPYWEAIAVTTLGIRFLLIPVVVKTTQSTARLSHLRPTLQKISEAMKNDPRASENAVREHYQKEMQAAFLKYKVHPLHAMLWPLAQMPVFLSMFFAVQSMGTFYPGMVEGGAFWFTNLTLPDPTYAFPIINALSFLAMIEMGASDVQMEQSKMFKNVMRGLAVLTLPFTATMPQSTFIFWTTNNMFSLVQGIAMKNPAVKKFFDVPDMLTTNAPNLKIANPVEKLQEYLADKKDNEANAKAEILDGVSKTKASSSNTPPPVFYDTPAHKRKEKK